MPADVPLDRMSTEELQKLRDELRLERRAKAKAKRPLPIFEGATTNDVIRMVNEVEDHLLTLKTMLGQWQINMQRLGAEKFAQQDRRPRLAPERLEPTS